MLPFHPELAPVWSCLCYAQLFPSLYPSCGVQFEAMEAEIETLRRELERGQRRSAEVLAGALAEKEKQAEEDLKQLLLVLAAKEDKLQADLENLQSALEGKDAQHDRLMKVLRYTPGSGRTAS